MQNGYNWTISADEDGWVWAVRCRDTGSIIVEGRAPSRPAAAAMVIRATVRDLTEAPGARYAA